MTCRDCEQLLAQQERNAEVEQHLRDCAGCRALAEDLAANAAVLDALRSEELPGIVVKIPKRRRLYPWAAAAAAAAFVIGMLAPKAAPPAQPGTQASEIPGPIQAVAPRPVPAKSRPRRIEPLKIKMLTSDPDVVIYWLIDN